VVAVVDLVPGDLITVARGDVIPADGRFVEGEGEVGLAGVVPSSVLLWLGHGPLGLTDRKRTLL
jgi:high-affinity K+ transport system ATPase subunit B